jgi:hypothetical protein
MNKKGHLFASNDDLFEMNTFYGDIKQALAEAEESGLLVVTDQQHCFPKVGG